MQVLTHPAVIALLEIAVPEATLLPDGSHTIPRSWGVYEIEPPLGTATRRFRLGNHPVRERELAAEFGRVKRIALFTSRSLEADLERLLNRRE